MHLLFYYDKGGLKHVENDGHLKKQLYIIPGILYAVYTVLTEVVQIA